MDPGTATDEDWAVLDKMNHDFLLVQDDLLYSDSLPVD